MFQDFFKHYIGMNYWTQFGGFVLIASVGLLIYTGNFPWVGRHEKNRVNSIEKDMSNRSFDSKEAREYKFYKLNRAITKMALMALTGGLTLMVIGIYKG